ncbi:MAG: SIR2 family protein [Acidobacteriota bacterium]
MDEFLIDYIKSGKAWLFIGSGPSIEMGYPSWSELASIAIDTVKIESVGTNHKKIEVHFKKNEYPKVFEEAKKILGGHRLLQILSDNLKSTSSSEIYKLISEWPIAVYLTTNYDDEIQRHLTHINEVYISHSNSEDHMKYLLPDTRGIIVKLHGDLRSEKGLILTESQYQEILLSRDWEYWRQKMTHVFHDNRIIIIGHSLTDNNIKHVLEVAKVGAGVIQPICWIAPDPTNDQIREFLEKYRIRVIPYDNREGDHKNLIKVIRQTSYFIPQRESISISEQIAKVSQSPLGKDAAAPGFFVFNNLAKQDDFEDKRVNIVIAAMQAAVNQLTAQGTFTLKDAFEISGWPSDMIIPIDFFNEVMARVIDEELFEPVGDRFKVGSNAEKNALDNKLRFELFNGSDKTKRQ